MQSQLVQGHSHSRLNVSPLKEVSDKVEAAASGGYKPQPIILSAAELLKVRNSETKVESTYSIWYYTILLEFKRKIWIPI